MANNNPRRPGAAPRVVCTVRVDPLVWKVAKTTADGLGVPIASVIERQLTAFIRSASTPDGVARYLTELPNPNEGLF